MFVKCLTRGTVDVPHPFSSEVPSLEELYVGLEEQNKTKNNMKEAKQ